VRASRSSDRPRTTVRGLGEKGPRGTPGKKIKGKKMYRLSTFRKGGNLGGGGRDARATKPTSSARDGAKGKTRQGKKKNSKGVTSTEGE